MDLESKKSRLIWRSYGLPTLPCFLFSAVFTIFPSAQKASVTLPSKKFSPWFMVLDWYDLSLNPVSTIRIWTIFKFSGSLLLYLKNDKSHQKITVDTWNNIHLAASRPSINISLAYLPGPNWPHPAHPTPFSTASQVTMPHSSGLTHLWKC